MTVRVERDGDEIVVEAPQVYVERVKEIPGVRRDSATRTWRVKLSWAACVIARGVFGAELEVGPALNDTAGSSRP
jgi:hypothetical protein